ncbi:YmdB family metallophosphoesterase [Aerophototrophica crusticola]|uniref:YmdB family metallophosphoesterase n=1 Tax=Aerophototrophica crusticola TaxID=1709002 RepID=A0A858R7G1_9PROT|nr:YmdB family metallophosphoesterase [Rhodospirillaceae bacterium B3]
MRLLFLGDVVGRSGREGVLRHLPGLRDRLKPDFIVVNGENAAGGFGITEKIAQEFFAAGVDCITLGNHSWDQKELVGQIDRIPNLIRPINYPEGTPGRGFTVLPAKNGRHKVLVINAMARVFMDPMDDPFAAADKVLKVHQLGGARMGPAGVDAVIMDFHGEATSEKMVMGHFLDGRASLVVGTHSHVPTADLQILNGGTAYQSDAGMCGDYDSVIGMKKDAAMWKMLRKIPGERFSPAENDATVTVCGVFVETDDRTGLARRAEAIRVGGRLKESVGV